MIRLKAVGALLTRGRYPCSGPGTSSYSGFNTTRSPSCDPTIPSKINPAPNVMPDIVDLPNHFAMTVPEPSVIVASTESRPSRGSIRMFCITPARRNRSRARASDRGVMFGRVSIHRRRFSALISAGCRESFSRSPFRKPTAASMAVSARSERLGGADSARGHCRLRTSRVGACDQPRTTRSLGRDYRQSLQIIRTPQARLQRKEDRRLRVRS